MRGTTLMVALAAGLLANGCSCGVTPVDDMDAGTGGGTTMAGGGSTAGGSAAGGGGSAGGGAAGGMTAGGDAGGAAGGGDAGGSVGGGMTAGGAAGGMTAGGAAGGMTAGGAAGGMTAGGAAGGITAGGTAGGMAAGGAAGGMAAGGAAGGMTAGGMAGGAAGGVTGDVYVCGNCPNANSMNPGTQALPVDTIVRGITLAVSANRPRVHVATRFGNFSHTYTEDITMAEGKPVDGRWSVTQSSTGLTWAQTAPRTELRNTAATGLKFPAGLTAATTLQGFAITTAGAGFSGGRVAGVTITQSSPVVRDFEISAPQIGIGNPTEAIGVDVVGAPMAVAQPTFESGNTAASVVNAGNGTMASVALSATLARVTSTGVTWAAGNGGNQMNGLSVGVFLVNAPGSVIQRGTASAGAATSCVGVLSSGSASGTRIEGVTATGCPRVPNVLNPPRFGVGVLFDACGPLMPGGAAPIVRNVTATGGVVGGTGSSAIGGAALDGCNVRFESQGATSSFTGASGAPSFGAGPENAVGIACSFAGFANRNGFDARCSLNGVTAVGSNVTAATNAVGLVCDGTCSNQGLTCQGSCGEVIGNTLTGGAGTQINHALVRHSSPALRQNRLGVGAGGVNCANNGAVAALNLEGTGGSVVNNLIVAGNCLTSIGVTSRLAVRQGGVPSTLFHSNTIVSTVGGSGSAPLVSIGVQLSGPAGSLASAVGGEYRNNIIYAGNAQGAGSVAVAFREEGTTGDPSALQNNLFFTAGSNPNTTLYVDEGSSLLTTAAAINGLMGATGNLAGNPNFQNAGNGNFAPSAGSPALGAGTTVGAPTVDLNGAPRPAPTSTQPDIGCIEVSQ
ncbi:MAG: choice-of-anchor Q domain-containing protein [Myxococcaceae bacterium]|nr:choice-of-anchor Q domain-containing protein [Myxococcaceae bacterium]